MMRSFFRFPPNQKKRDLEILDFTPLVAAFSSESRKNEIWVYGGRPVPCVDADLHRSSVPQNHEGESGATQGTSSALK